MKRILSILIVALLALGALAPSALALNDFTLPLTDEPATFSFWYCMHNNARKLMTDMNENWSFQEIEKRTGVHLDFVVPAAGQEREQFNLMVASQDLTDFIENVDYYPGGIGKMMEDGFLLPLNDLVAEYAPNVQYLLDEYPEIKLESRTNTGKMWGFAIWGMWEEDRPISPWAGPGIRKDWLDDLGLDMPVTIADWEKVLTAFKEEKGAIAPLIMAKNGQSLFMSAFDIGMGFYPKDGKVLYGYAEPAFKDYLTLMNDWYNKGLLDPNFATTASDSNYYAEYLTTGKAGAIQRTYHDILPLYNSLLEEGQSMVAVGHPRLTEDQELHVGQLEFRVASRKTGINSKIENPELAMKWWNYAYSDEGSMIFNWGIEGKTYEMVDGKPRFLDSIVNNEDGMAYGVWGWKYKLFNGAYQFDMWAMPEDQVEQSVASVKVWGEGNDRSYNMPPVEMDLGETDEYNNIMSEINTYKDQMILKFIMGVEPLDNFDEYVSTLKEMGLDRAIEIQQNALTLYQAR